MSEWEGGRFCGSCQHEVADLTHATDTELLRLFGGEAEAPKCARFDPRQLDRVLRPAHERQASALPIAAFTTLVALLSGTETLAQQGVVVGKPLGTEQTPRSPACDTPALLGEVQPTSAVRTERTIIINGRLLDASAQPAPSGHVQAPTVQRSVRTDDKGGFSMTLISTSDSVQLYFHAHRHDPFVQFVSWTGVPGTDPITIDLGDVRMGPAQPPEEMMMGKMAIERRPTWRFRPNKP